MESGGTITRRHFAGITLGAAASAACFGGENRPAPAEIGHPWPATWEWSAWINTPRPVSRLDLRGRVILIRWFTGPPCPYCAATAPALETWHRRWEKAGLSVIGAYHHKSPEPFSREDVEAVVKRYGITFPVAIDAGWKTLRRWWLDGPASREWTSVSFLIDRRGTVRHIHPGGQYVPGDEAHSAMERHLRTLLAEPVPLPRTGTNDTP